jgi:tetratricopeptide (TPR) repeat protein
VLPGVGMCLVRAVCGACRGGVGTRILGCALLAAVCLTGVAPAQAGPVEDAVTALQHDWEVIRYQTPASDRARRLEVLAGKAHRISQTYPDRSEALTWEGIIVSTWADEKGGLGALGLAKQAKALYEAAIRIDGSVLDGSAYLCLGALYYKVPRWPIGFGDTATARALLQKAMALNPTGLDANYFYGEYLLSVGQPAEAVSYLQRALQAPLRPGHYVADTGRREEARALLEKAQDRLR